MNNRTKTIIEIDHKTIGEEYPTYFVADIAANHDSDLGRAKELIALAAEAGANAAKFQHFQAETIVSDLGFKSLESQLSHQSKWDKSVYETYREASLDLSWTEELLEACKNSSITFFTSPYSIELVDKLDPFIPAYKIGSGDITWIEMIKHIAQKQKPYMLATGASNINDVQRAVDVGLGINPSLVLMQCNTDYTVSLEKFKCIQLRVLTRFRDMYPELVLGLSDHTPGHATVLGAVALGARVIEKHFTDDINRNGPDHAFSMTPHSWKEMVERTRELEFALGSEEKKIEENENATVILQRRSIRLVSNISAGTTIERRHLEMLRPCPKDALNPYDEDQVVGKKIRKFMKAGSYIRWQDLN